MTTELTTAERNLLRNLYDNLVADENAGVGLDWWIEIERREEKLAYRLATKGMLKMNGGDYEVQLTKLGIAEGVK